uniref:uncharacterized protein LOC123458802 n=1 Tax=Jaculus jaculus TaxID=51337 RepID=UPI001E1B2D6D|nr:uncharacterized protein LOC123458802 [Jaculus jaculus]
MGNPVSASQIILLLQKSTEYEARNAASSSEAQTQTAPQSRQVGKAKPGSKSQLSRAPATSNQHCFYVNRKKAGLDQQRPVGKCFECSVSILTRNVSAWTIRECASHILHTPPPAGLPRPQRGEGERAGRPGRGHGRSPGAAEGRRPGPRGPRPERLSTHRAGRPGPEGRPRLAGAQRLLPSLLVASVRTPGDPGRHDVSSVFSMITWQKRRQAARFSSGGCVGDIQCQLLPFDRRQPPPGQNKFEGEKRRRRRRRKEKERKGKGEEPGEGEGKDEPLQAQCRASRSQACPTHLPALQTYLPSTHRAQAPPGQRARPPRAPRGFVAHTCRLAPLRGCTVSV